MSHRVSVKKRPRKGYSKAAKFWFDKQAASDAVEFIETFCTHTKGELAGQPLILSDWERHIIEELFGWKRQDGLRQYRVLWLEIPRKNGKSLLSAAIALLLLFADGEPGAEIYSAAGDREQASIVFDIARTMRESEPELAAVSQVFGGQGGVKRQITYGNSFYRVLSSDAYTKHGLNAHGIVVDEVHVQRTRDLIDTLKTSVGSRRQPLEVYITTAGYDKQSICWELHEYARKIIQGYVKDDSFLPFIYAAGPKDDWRSPATWAKANPGLGVSVKIDYLEQECKRAQDVPGYENTFRRLHLNQWTEQASRWLQMYKWDLCGGALPDLSKRRCFAGLDLASTTDIAALCLVFPGEKWHVLAKFWVPEEGIRIRSHRDRVQYDVWQKEGWIKATEGDVIDYDVIRSDIVDLSQQYNIEEIAIDRWNATQITTQLQGEGFKVELFGQGFASMSAPAKFLEALMLGDQLRHGSNPVLTWMASNVSAKQDAAGNIKPDKSASSEKIDGIVALIMALGIGMKEGESVYETRGLREV